MNRLEAERLLGGYATDTLTESEKKVLFTAALEHQDVFDALMDEEALRELLSDPMTRQHLLGLLSGSGSGSAKVRPFWRRPAVMGVAASLFLIVTTSLVLRRQPEVQLVVSAAPKVAKESEGKSAGDMDAQVTIPLPKTAREKTFIPPRASVSSAPALPKKVESVAEAMEYRREDSVEAPATAVAPTPTQLDHQKIKGAPATEGLAAAPLGLVASGQGEKAKPSDKAAAKQARATLTESSLSGSKATETEASQRVPGGPQKKAPSFLPHLEQLSGDRYRLIVTWGPEGYLYLLKRSGSDVRAIPSISSTVTKSGGLKTVFEFSSDDQEVLDLYLLSQPVADPALIPPANEGEGHWQRILPR
jgi:hypothetical protein